VIDYLIAGLIIVGPWLIGGFLGWRWGCTWPRACAAIGLGLAATSVGLAAFLVTSSSSAEVACGEDTCLRYLGHWLEATLARDWPIYSALAWVSFYLVLALLHPAERPTG